MASLLSVGYLRIASYGHKYVQIFQDYIFKKHSEHPTKDSVTILKINHAYLKIEISTTSYGVFVLLAK